MRFLPVLLLLIVGQVAAGAVELRPSARVVEAQPEYLLPGRCVAYAESDATLVATVPEYFVRGKVLDARVVERRLARCPEVVGRGIENYSREEFNRLVLAQPCVSADRYARDVKLGLVRLQVAEWETPHARRAANGGRLYRGMFIAQKLEAGMEIELEADLLGACEQ
ncbi:MAG: hypothetical protein WCA83_08655 [Azonexus sp.]